MRCWVGMRRGSWRDWRRGAPPGARASDGSTSSNPSGRGPLSHRSRVRAGRHPCRHCRGAGRAARDGAAPHARARSVRAARARGRRADLAAAVQPAGRRAVARSGSLRRGARGVRTRGARRASRVALVGLGRVACALDRRDEACAAYRASTARRALLDEKPALAGGLPVMRYKPEVLDELARHGLRPRPDTPPGGSASRSTISISSRSASCAIAAAPASSRDASWPARRRARDAIPYSPSRSTGRNKALPLTYVAYRQQAGGVVEWARRLGDSLFSADCGPIRRAPLSKPAAASAFS